MISTHAIVSLVSLAAALASGCKSSDTAQAANRASAAPASAKAPNDSISDRADRGRIQGSADAKVWIVEASDFQCPYCKGFHDDTYPLILRDYVKTGKVRIAYLNFPLDMHPHAQQAAEAAMCASVQDKFWPMHDSLFVTQPRWAERADATPVFDSLAVEVGVDAAQWRTCTQKHLTAALIEADKARSTANGVRSTPSFFVGSMPVVGAQPFSVFQSAIDSALVVAGSGQKR